MKRLALLFSVVLVLGLSTAHAQTFTPSSCTFNQAEQGPFDYPCAITITSSGTYSLQGACCTPEIAWFDSSGNHITSVTAPATIYASCQSPGGDCDNQNKGTYPTGGTFCCGDLKIGTVSVPVTLNVTARMKLIYSNAGKVVDASLPNCTNSSAIWDYKDTCTLSTQALGGYTPPGEGASYSDRNFATTIYELATMRHDYAVVNSFSLDDQYVIVGNNTNGYAGGSAGQQSTEIAAQLLHTGIYSTITKLKAYQTPCQQFNKCGGGAKFSNKVANRIYNLDPAPNMGWHQYHLGVPPNLVDDGVIYTPSVAGELINDGGSGNLSQEDFRAFYESSPALNVSSVSGTLITVSGGPLLGLAVGKTVQIRGTTDSSLNANWTVQTAPTNSSFTITYSSPGASGGTVAVLDKMVVADLSTNPATVVLSFPFEAIPNQPMEMRGVHMTDKDSSNGKRFLLAQDDYSFVNQNHYYAQRVLSFKQGDTNPTFEFYGPLQPESPAPIPLGPSCNATQAAAIGNCYTSAHASELNINGTIWAVHVGGNVLQQYAVARRLTAGGDYSAIPFYKGGGYAFWNAAPDHMCGSRLAPFLATSGDYANNTVFSLNITSVSGNTYTIDDVPISISSATNANPVVFTFSSLGNTPTWGAVDIAGATGVNWSTVNGVKTPTWIDATHFSISGVDSTTWGALTGTVTFHMRYAVGDSAIIAVDDFSATDATLDGTYTVQTVPSDTTFTLTKTPSSYTPNSAITYKAGTDPNINQGHGQVTVCRQLPDGRMLQCRRIAQHLSTQFWASYHDNGYSAGGSGNDYWAQPHVTISPNGKWVGWASNLMHGNRNYFYIAPTGFLGNLDPDQFTPTTRVTVQPLATSALFQAASLPDMSQQYKIEVATDLAISSGLMTNTVSANALASGTTAGFSLSANTSYCWRARSLDDYYVATGCFSTPAAPVGNTTISMAGLAPAGTANAIIEYGATSNLGSSSSSVACTVGQQCTPSVSLARGAVYYKRIDFRDSGNNVLASSPIEQIAIQ